LEVAPKTNIEGAIEGESDLERVMKRPPYEKLAVWKLAMDFADAVYDATEYFPRREWNVSARQCRRASLSVSSNIVEGYMRRTKREYRQYLYQARGSLNEARSQLKFCRRRDFLTKRTFDSLESIANRTSFLLQREISSLQLAE
jgi:four helix bundle protein